MLNTVILLRRHAGAHAALAEAMGRRESVARCIEVIEANLGDAPLKPLRGADEGEGEEGSVPGGEGEVVFGSGRGGDAAEA